MVYNNSRITLILGWLVMLLLSGQLLSLHAQKYAGQALSDKKGATPYPADTSQTLAPPHRQLEEVMVTATPLHRKLEALPGSITVLRNLQPSTQQTTDINRLLEQVPGIQMQAGTQNTARLTIRGIGSRSPYASNRIRAYLNEIPLTGGDGATVVEDLEIWETGSIEIIKGPSSALYGSGLGGALVFRPRISYNEFWSGHMVMETASFNSWKKGASLTWNDTLKTIQSSLYRTTSDGYRQNSRHERTNGRLMVQGSLGRHQISYLLNYTDLYAQIPSSVNYESYRNTPELAAPNWLAVEGFQQYRKWMHGLTLTLNLKPPFKNHLSLYALFNDAHESRPFNILTENSVTTGLRNRLVYTKNNMAASAGFELFGEEYQWKTYETLSGVKGDLLTGNNDHRFFLNLFSHFEWRPWSETRFSAGINLHHVRFSSQTSVEETGLSTTTRYPHLWVVSPRLGLSHQVAPLTWLFASAGHGFSVPSSEEALLPDGTINKNLKPEEGLHLETGIRRSLFNHRLTLEVAAYRIWVKNLLITRRDVEDQFYGINAGQTIHQGLESRAVLNVIPPHHLSKQQLTLSLSHTLMDNYFVNFYQNEEQLKGRQLPGLPSSQLVAQINYQTSFGLSGSLQFSHINPQYLDDQNTLKYPGHELLDWTLAYGPKQGWLKHLQFKGGVQNLLNARYASMIVVNAPSFGSAPPRYYYPGTPRNFYLGVSYRFD